MLGTQSLEAHEIGEQLVVTCCAPLTLSVPLPKQSAEQASRSGGVGIHQICLIAGRADRYGQQRLLPDNRTDSSEGPNEPGLVMPTFADQFVAELARSGVLEHLKPWGELFVEFQKMLGGMFLMATAIAERAEENFPLKAHGPYLEAQGFAPFLARGLRSSSARAT